MTVAWNVYDEKGPVDQLDRLAAVLNTSPQTAAKDLMADPDLYAAAPESLRREVKAFKPKPGGGTPPPISNGSFVSWSGGKGRVDLIVTNGKVPGVSGDVEGTDKSPAARVIVYEDGKSTGRKVGVSTHTLKRIPPINAGTKKKSAAPAALVSLVADHETRCEEMELPSHARVTGFAVKAVYDRGLAGYPGPDRTVLTAQEWALGRVQHFAKVAIGDEDTPGHDTDLLAPEHPMHTPATPLARVPAPGPTEPAEPPPGLVRIDRDAVEAEVKALMEPGD